MSTDFSGRCLGCGQKIESSAGCSCGYQRRLAEGAAFAEALAGGPTLLELETTIQRHRELAAYARVLLYNNGFGSNNSQQAEIDSILLEIASIPPA